MSELKPTAPIHKDLGLVNGFLDHQQNVLSDWFASEIHDVLKGTCKAVKDHNQPCTTRGWFNAVLDTKFFEE